MRTMLTVACRIPGGFGKYVAFDSKTSLLDSDLILFSPAYRFYYGPKEYMGKPSLDDTDSFNLQFAISHWHRELEIVLKAGKNVFLLMNAPREVFVSTGKKEYSKSSETRIVRPLSNYDLLPSSIKVVESNGKSMSLHPNERILGDYWRKFGEYSNYKCLIEDSNEIRPLVVTRQGNRIVGAIMQTKGGGDLILLPWLDFYREEFFSQGWDERYEYVDLGYDFDEDDIDGNEEWTPKAKGWGKQFIDSLESIDKMLTGDRESTPVPQWARNERFKTAREVALSEQTPPDSIKDFRTWEGTRIGKS